MSTDDWDLFGMLAELPLTGHRIGARMIALRAIW